MNIELLRRIIQANSPWMADAGRFHSQANTCEERTLAQMLWREITTTPISQRACHKVILGPRRVGKTTVLKHLAKRAVTEQRCQPEKLVFLSLDDDVFTGIRLHELLEGIKSITGASEKEPCFLLLDEIVYSGGWNKTLKRAYDEPALYPFRIVCTSGSSSALNRGMIESWAGRASEYYLLPSQMQEAANLVRSSLPFPDFFQIADKPLREIIKHIAPDSNDKLLQEYFWDLASTGGCPENLYPRPMMNDGEKAEFMVERHGHIRQIITQILQRDIEEYSKISNPIKASAILRLAAEHPGREVVRKEWAKNPDISMAETTLDRYFAALDDAMLLFLLPNYSGPKRKKKVFFYDNSVPAALSFRTPEQMRDSERGWSAENMVAASLNGLVKLTLGRAKLSHLRDKGCEIDFVLEEERGGTPLAIEVGSSYTNKMRKLQGVKKLLSKSGYNQLAGNTYVVTPDAPVDHHSEIKSVPLTHFMLAIEVRQNYLLQQGVST